MFKYDLLHRNYVDYHSNEVYSLGFPLYKYKLNGRSLYYIDLDIIDTTLYMLSRGNTTSYSIFGDMLDYYLSKLT